MSLEVRPLSSLCKQDNEKLVRRIGKFAGRIFVERVQSETGQKVVMSDFLDIKRS